MHSSDSGSYYKKDLATFYGAEQVIDWSLKIDYFLTAACGLFWLNVNYMQNETAIQRLDCPNVWKWANLTHTSCTQSPKHEGSSVTSVPYNMLVTHTRARRVQVRGQRVSRLQLEQALPTQKSNLSQNAEIQHLNRSSFCSAECWHLPADTWCGSSNTGIG